RAPPGPAADRGRGGVRPCGTRAPTRPASAAPLRTPRTPFNRVNLYPIEHYADRMAVKRRYDASGRQRQALRTRAAILDAAGRLFVRDGYAATPLTAV